MSVEKLPQVNLESQSGQIDLTKDLRVNIGGKSYLILGKSESSGQGESLFTQLMNNGEKLDKYSDMSINMRVPKLLEDIYKGSGDERIESFLFKPSHDWGTMENYFRENLRHLGLYNPLYDFSAVLINRDNLEQLFQKRETFLLKRKKSECLLAISAGTNKGKIIQVFRFNIVSINQYPEGHVLASRRIELPPDYIEYITNNRKAHRGIPKSGNFV